MAGETRLSVDEMVHFAGNWHKTFSGGHIGLLLLGPVDNSRRPTPLDEQKLILAAHLGERYGSMTRVELRQLPVLQTYHDYYRQFGNTYHVQLQLESVAHKGKRLPNVSPLVDACFAAEMDTHLLTASHDAEQLAFPLAVAASTGEELLEMLNGKPRQVKANDMLMRDGEGPICTILYGQNRRTAVTPQTKQVLYVTYAPAGITRDQVANHHETLLRNVYLFAPAANVEWQTVVTARRG